MLRRRPIQKVKHTIGLMAALLTLAITQFVFTQPASAVVMSPNAFVFHHTISASNGVVNCPSSEVMVGIHFGQGKAICAALNHGYVVASTITDGQGGTQVSDNPKMHGCPNAYLIQGINLPSETLTCVALRDSAGNALDLTNFVHDGRGPNDNGTQSSIYGLTSPTMHACGFNLAMKGAHQSQNDLFCAG